jgi:hypothetical protein
VRGAEAPARSAAEIADVLAGEDFEGPGHVGHREQRVQMTVVGDQRPVHIGAGQVGQGVAERFLGVDDERALHREHPVAYGQLRPLLARQLEDVAHGEQTDHLAARPQHRIRGVAVGEEHVVDEHVQRHVVVARTTRRSRPSVNMSASSPRSFSASPADTRRRTTDRQTSRARAAPGLRDIRC